MGRLLWRGIRFRREYFHTGDRYRREDGFRWDDCFRREELFPWHDRLRQQNLSTTNRHINELATRDSSKTTGGGKRLVG